MASYDIAVIGGGPAGLATAMYAGLRGLRTVLFEAESFGGQLVNLYPSKPVTNFPAQLELPSRDLALLLADQAAHFGAELRERTPVDDVAPSEAGFVVSAAGATMTATTLTLALGLGRFRPRRLGVAGEERFLGKGLTYRLPPIDQIAARHAVVVGGGDSAVDTALSLARVADVTLVHRRGGFRAYARSLDELEAAGVRVITGGEVVELRGGARLEGAVVSVGDDASLELPADLVLVTIGQVPDLGAVEGWRLGIRGPHLEVDTAMRTALPGVFAAGDFAAYPGKVKMIATAVAEGSTAAASAQRYVRDAS